MAQMALAWVLRQPAVTSALVGASRVSQVEDSVCDSEKVGFHPGRIEFHRENISWMSLVLLKAPTVMWVLLILTLPI